MDSDFVWYNEVSRQFVEKDYLLPGQTLTERVDIIANNAERILNRPGFAKKFKANLQRGWYSLSTPIWANFGTDRALPISCFSSYCEDSCSSILGHAAEIGMMSKMGGGTSIYLGKLRPRGSTIRDNGKSSGSVHFAQLFDTLINVFSQGATRRGSLAVYQDIDHPDIKEFLTIRSEGSPIQDLSFGVCVKNKWMEEMIAGDQEKREIWATVIRTRIHTGYPYIVFIDSANEQAPQVYKDRNLVVNNSTLCVEIFESTKEDESLVCCLASMNDLYFDEWKDDPDAVEILTYLLDAVMEEFIQKASKVPYMERAVRFAQKQRALGIGQLGWHSYLQSKMIPFESMKAKMLNVQIAKNIQQKSIKASEKLAKEYGEPELMKGYGRRNALLQAIAPTKSSSFILGQVSEGIEPFRSNYYVKDLAKGKFGVRNVHLKKLLEEKGKDTQDVWSNILDRGGSVQHLDFLSQEEKDVFKTFSEISPMEVIIQASQRQKYIDQGQSLNLMINENVPTKDINKLLIEGWKLGLKSYYYHLSTSVVQEFTRDILSCKSCES